MKRFIALLLVIIVSAAILVSCKEADLTPDGDGDNTQNNGGSEIVVGDNAYSFKYNNIEITPNAEANPIIEALGEPLSYTEDTSCGFEDKDRSYEYNGFIIDTVVYNKIEYIYYIQIKSDVVSTPEGAYVGMTPEEIQAKYTGQYEMVDGHVVVRFNGGILRFFVKNGVCNSITYESTSLKSQDN